MLLLKKSEEDKLDILLNNAGIYKSDSWRSHTQDNIEIVTMTNYLGHFLLTNLLMEKLKKSAPSRIVNVSSLGHYAVKSMNFEDFDMRNVCLMPSDFHLYTRSKAALVMFTKELHRRYKGKYYFNFPESMHFYNSKTDFGITSYSCNPGIADTELGRNINPITDCCLYCLSNCTYFKQKLKTPQQAAQTPIFCCLEQGLEKYSGSYYSYVHF